MRHHLIWHGHSAFQLDTGGITILIDPFFDGNPGAVRKATDIPEADFVLVTHDHRDHVGQAVDICKRTGARLCAVVETAAKLVSQGLPEAQVVNDIGFNVGGSMDCGTVRVTMVQAVHSSRSGVAVGYILRLADGFVLYHAGDTAVFAGMELLGRMHAIDLALLPIGGVFTMDARQAAVACTLLRCRQVAAMHWGSFAALAQSVEGFASQLENLGAEAELLRLEPGKPIELEGPDNPACDCAKI